MKKIVVRDAAGQVINIGPWDYGVQNVKVRRIDEPAEFIDIERITNPLPEGATESEEEVIERADGGLAAAADYQRLRQPEYPPIADQLDALWKGGADLEAMRARILAIKSKYPKA